MNRKNRNKKNKLKKINGPEKLKIKINLYSLKLNANQLIITYFSNPNHGLVIRSPIAFFANQVFG